MIGCVRSPDLARPRTILARLLPFAMAIGLIVPAVWGLSAVSADAAAPTHFFKIGDEAGLIAPNAFLIGRNYVDFSPKRLAHNSGDLDGLTPVSGSSCSVKDYSFSVTNNSPGTQILLYGTQPVVSIPPKEAFAICVSDPGKYKLSLSSNPAAKLKIVVG